MQISRISEAEKVTDSELDKTDRKILALLQEDARLTNNDIAERIHLSPSQCSRRRARLEREGVIAGYHARLDGEKAVQTAKAKYNKRARVMGADEARNHMLKRARDCDREMAVIQS